MFFCFIISPLVYLKQNKTAPMPPEILPPHRSTYPLRQPQCGLGQYHGDDPAAGPNIFTNEKTAGMLQNLCVYHEVSPHPKTDIVENI